MTGTPIENHLGELWALMDILNPGLLGSREWFTRTFASPIQRRRTTSTRSSGCGRSCSRSSCAGAKDDAGGRARPAADHGREGLLPADGRAGEPVPGDGRQLAAARRGARRPVRPPRRGARDARAAEAGVQPPGDAGAHGRAARRALGQARAAGRAAARRCRPATRRSSSRSTRASTASSRTSRSASTGASASSTAG